MKFNQKKIDVSTVVVNREKEKAGNIFIHLVIYIIVLGFLGFIWYDTPEKIIRKQLLKAFENPVERKNILDEFILVFNEHKETHQFSASSLNLWEKSQDSEKNKYQSVSMKMSTGQSITLSPFLFTAENSSILLDTNKHTGTYFTKCGIKKETYSIISSCLFIPYSRETKHQDIDGRFKVYSRIAYNGNEPTLTETHFLDKGINTRLVNVNRHHIWDLTQHLSKMILSLILGTYALFSLIPKLIARKVFRGLHYLFKSKLNRRYDKLPTVKITILKKKYE